MCPHCHTLQTGKGFAGRASTAPSKRAATELAEEGSTALSALLQRGARAIEDLRRVSRSLRSLPYVDPSLPTLALVGAPNVGKSSLVRLLSSGAPEVCNYPFTTRSIKMGHFYVDGARHQVRGIVQCWLPHPCSILARWSVCVCTHMVVCVWGGGWIHGGALLELSP